MRKLSIFILLFVLTETSIGHSNEDCLSISEKPVKVEAWVSKKYEQDYRKIRSEFAEMGNTKVGLFFYPAENPSRIVAIGRCIPVYMAQHFLKKAWEYSLGTTHLVHQGFVSSHWAGVGTSLFSEHSMSSITPQQLNKLMDHSLDTESFHKIYRRLTTQKKKVSAFGLILDNPKLLRNNLH